jgi:membrane-associated phospholipid phosphatase
MAVTLVYAGKHYVVDVLGGWVFAGAVVALVNLAYGRAPARGYARSAPEG